MTDANVFIAWGALLTAILGPMSGVVIAIIANRRSKKTADGQTQITDKQLNIKERDVDTHYWSALVEGFAAQVSAQQEQIEAQGKTIERLQTKYESLEQQINADMTAKQEMLAHIMSLEQLVPNPPGAPKRPWL